MPGVARRILPAARKPAVEAVSTIEPRPFLIMRSGVLDGEEGPEQIGLQDLLPLLDGLFEERRWAAENAGIGKDDVNAAERRQRTVDDGSDLVFLADVRAETLHVAAFPADGGYDRRRPHVRPRARTGSRWRGRCRSPRR